MTDKQKLIGVGILAAYLFIERLAAGSLLKSADKELKETKHDRDVWKERAENQRLMNECLTVDNRALSLKVRRGF